MIVARCPNCGAHTFTARVPADVSFGRLEVVLDAISRPDGPLWVDDDGVARAVSVFYVDGAPRYTPHARVCRAFAEEWQDARDRDHDDDRAALGWADAL